MARTPATAVGTITTSEVPSAVCWDKSGMYVMNGTITIPPADTEECGQKAGKNSEDDYPGRA